MYIIVDFKHAQAMYMEFIHWVRESPYLAFFAIVLFYMVSIGLMFPIVTTHLLVGFSYAQVFDNKWKGTAVAWVVSFAGTFLGALCGFLISRYLFMQTITSIIKKNKWLNKNFRAINGLLEENGVLVISLLRVMFTPFSLLSHVFGVTSISVYQFCLGNLSYSIICLAQVFIGASFYKLSTNDFGLAMKKESKFKKIMFVIELILTLVITLGMSWKAKTLIQKKLDEYERNHIVDNSSGNESIRTDDSTECQKIQLKPIINSSDGPN